MKRPTKADLYEGVPFADYLAWEAESRTGLVAMADSPAEYLRAKACPITPTERMLRGTGVDLLLFEGPAALSEQLATRPQRMGELPAHYVEVPSEPDPEVFYVLPAGEKLTTKSGKAFIDKHADGRIPTIADQWTGGLSLTSSAGKRWATRMDVAGCIPVPATAWKDGGLDMATSAGRAWAAEQRDAGRAVVTADTWSQVHGAADAARANELARHYLCLDGGGLHQPSLLWQDDETGAWLKARPDALRLRDNDAVLGDLKVTVDPRPETLGGRYHRHIADMRYHWQGGLYAWGVREVTGRHCDAFHIIAIQGEAPHRVEHHVISDADSDGDGYPGALSAGLAEVRAQLRLLEQCRRLDYWPKESGLSHPFALSRWQRQ